MARTLNFQLNGRSTVLSVEPDRPLLWVLRTNLGLTGTKYGCGESHCGACTVLVDEKPVRSCQTPVLRVYADLMGASAGGITGAEYAASIGPDGGPDAGYFLVEP